MNKQLTRRVWAIFSALFLMSSLSFSQIENFDFLKSAPNDAAKFLQAYFTPYANAFGAGLNGGWYNTAKPHKVLGFDITASFNVGMVPSSAGTFNPSSLQLSNQLTVTGNTTPSISGPKDNLAHFQYQAGGHTLASFDAPPGLNWRYIPVPTLQAGIGLPLGSELKVRYMPTINIKDGNLGLWGIGLMHNLTQYLPGNKLLPFDVSLFGGYTKLQGNIPISLQPGTPSSYTPAVNFSNQNMHAEVTALNVSAIASLNLPVITFYGGLGYSKTKTSLELSGNFPTPTPTATDPFYQYSNDGVKTGANFPKMEMNNFSGLRANIGFRLKLAILTIHADYTRAQYNVVSTGLGFSFR